MCFLCCTSFFNWVLPFALHIVWWQFYIALLFSLLVMALSLALLPFLLFRKTFQQEAFHIDVRKIKKRGWNRCSSLYLCWYYTLSQHVICWWHISFCFSLLLKKHWMALVWVVSKSQTYVKLLMTTTHPNLWEHLSNDYFVLHILIFVPIINSSAFLGVIDPFHNCKSSFPAMQLTEIMAASHFVETECSSATWCTMMRKM